MVALPSATIISVTIALLWCGKLLDVEIASRSRLLHDDACEPLHELKGLTNAIMQQRDLEAISEVCNAHVLQCTCPAVACRSSSLPCWPDHGAALV